MSEYQGNPSNWQKMDPQNGNLSNLLLSPSPKLKSLQPDHISSNLTDLSPFIEVHVGQPTPSLHRQLTADMTLIETPATTNLKSSYLEQIDEGIKSISRIIIWTNDSCSDLNEVDRPSVSDYDSMSSEINCSGLAQIQENLFEGSNSIQPQNCMEASQKMSLPKYQPKTNFPPATLNKEKKVQSPKKTCNCKKTQCLKLYCDCFRENRKCQGCSCVGCHNTEEFSQERSNAVAILTDKNPQAFRPKIQSETHTKGCNCKKSGCQKKYCECYQAGLACNSNCRCDECKNCNHSKPKSSQRRFNKIIPPNFTLKSKMKPYVIVPLNEKQKKNGKPTQQDK